MKAGTNGTRCEWLAMELVDRMRTMLAEDNRRAGDLDRARWHLERRDRFRRDLDACASAFCGRPVTGYLE